MITALCVTYGRVRWLQQALGDFLSQENPGDSELLIVNTLPRQTLAFDHPHVRILNLPRRPDSLGHARNIGVADAKGDRILIFDDDDHYLPHFLRTFHDNWPDDLDWVWLDKRLCAHGAEIKEISYGCHGGCFGFTKRVWELTGGYPDMTVGEDRLLVQKITKHPGKKIELDDSLPPFICCWGQGTYHVSGMGNDKPNGLGAHARIAAELSRRLDSRKEPTGRITLKADYQADWLVKAKSFMSQELKKNSMNNSDVCVVELGRYGDIVNILPILLHIHNRFGTPTLMVSREFADLLDGVSYVKPYPVDLRNDQLQQALTLARKQFKRVICAQIWGGPTYFQEKLCPSYNMESWRMCGFPHKFGEPTWKPLFDLRDKKREAALVRKLSHPTKPMLLMNMTSVSSPFRYGPLVSEAIQRILGAKFNIVDLGGLKLHRIYDLLGLMDVAACLVSADSAHLHLAPATNVPVVALVNDEPWLGTLVRPCNHIATTHYSHATPVGVVESIRYGAGSLTGFTLPVKFPPVGLASAPTRRLIHCVERHDALNDNETRRKEIAVRSWQAIYDQGVIACHLLEKDYPRSARDIGEKRNLPYLKDVLAAATDIADADDDIIFFTNDDNFLHSELPALLRYHVSLYDCASAQRCEFKHTAMPNSKSSPEAFANLSNRHMGRDLFAFTRKWLEAHWDEMPDFVLGCSEWDLCMAAMVRNHFGIKTTRGNLEQPIFPAELPLGYVSHLWHFAAWMNPQYVDVSPGQRWNREAFFEWAKQHAPHLKFNENLCI